MNADRHSHELEAASAPRNGPVSSANSAVDAVAAGCSGASPHGGDGPDPSSAVVVGPKVHQEDVFQYFKILYFEIFEIQEQTPTCSAFSGFLLAEPQERQVTLKRK